MTGHYRASLIKVSSLNMLLNRKSFCVLSLKYKNVLHRTGLLQKLVSTYKLHIKMMLSYVDNIIWKRGLQCFYASREECIGKSILKEEIFKWEIRSNFSNYQNLSPKIRKRTPTYGTAALCLKGSSRTKSDYDFPRVNKEECKTDSGCGLAWALYKWNFWYLYSLVIWHIPILHLTSKQRPFTIANFRITLDERWNDDLLLIFSS